MLKSSMENFGSTAEATRTVSAELMPKQIAIGTPIISIAKKEIKSIAVIMTLPPPLHCP